MHVITVLQELIKRASITPKDEGCQQYLTNYLKQAGFQTEQIDFAEVKNLWAVHGTGAPVTVFAGHTDVVPTGDISQWSSDPFEPVIKDGYLYGRGSADMKSGVAAMVAAAIDYVKQNPNHKGSIAIILTSDEEGPAQNGIKRLMPFLHARGNKIDYAVFTEPSSVTELGDMLKIGRRGSMHGYLTLKGKQGHIAYPDKTANPIHAAGTIIDKLSSEVWCNGNHAFQPTSFQISNINGGTGADNVVPGDVKFNFNWRFSTELTPEDLQSRTLHIIENCLANTAKQTGKIIDYDIDWHVSGEPFLTEEKTLVKTMKQVCQDVLGITPVLSTSGGTSDARFVAPFGVEVVEFGPVGKTIHQINECVKISDVEGTELVLKKLLERLYG